MMLTKNQGATFLCLVLFCSMQMFVAADDSTTTHRQLLKVIQHHTQNPTVELLNVTHTHRIPEINATRQRQSLLKHSTRRRLTGWGTGDTIACVALGAIVTCCGSAGWAIAVKKTHGLESYVGPYILLGIGGGVLGILLIGAIIHG